MINIFIIIFVNLFIVNYCYSAIENQLSVGREFNLSKIFSLENMDEHDHYKDSLPNEYKQISTWAGSEYRNVSFYVRGIPVDEYNIINNYKTNNSPDMILRITKDLSYMGRGRGGQFKVSAFLCDFVGWTENSTNILNNIRINDKLEKDKVTGLKSGTITISTMQDAIVALSPSEDDSYTYGLPLDGSLIGANKYYIWRGNLISLKNDIYTCGAISFDGRLKAFGLTKIKGKFTELIENKSITVIGKLTNIGEITLKSGITRKIAILTDCYIFP